MRAAEFITEAFNQPYATDLSDETEDGDYDSLTQLPDGSYLTVMFNNQGDGEYQVEFWRGPSQGVTGEGDAQRIFATVLSTIQRFIKEHNPWRLTFSATKDVEPGQNSESRAKLYNRLVDRYAAAWGYDAYNEDHGDQVEYELTRLKPGVTEGFPNFDFEWEEAERYPEFVNLGKKKWIELVSKGKPVTVTRKNVNKINNTDAADPNSFKLLDPEKQKRALAQLANGDVEMPIVARYSDGYLELIGGNTRLTAQMAKDGQAKVWLFNVPEELTQGVAEGQDDNGISFQVQKGKNKFATTLSIGNKPVGVYQYDADTGRSIAEVYPEFKGKGLGKLLVLHAIYTAAQLGLDFQEDESRTAEYDNVLDSLSSNGYIVDDDGYWYVTGEGEQYLQQSMKQGVAEATGDEKFDTMMSRMAAEPKVADMHSNMPPTSIPELLQWANKNNKPYHRKFAEWARNHNFTNVNAALEWFGDNVDPWDEFGSKEHENVFGDLVGEPLIDAAKHDPKAAELLKVYVSYEKIFDDWTDKYRQMNYPDRFGNFNEQGVAEGKHQNQQVVNAIQKVLPVAQEIWFHGSRATGQHRRNSDTDILVVVPDELVGDQYLGVVRILQKLSSHFDNYDIQPTKSGTNIHQIAQEEGKLLWSTTNENFADGKVKGKSRPGRVRRAGASCNGSVTDLRQRAKNASGEKAKMYHWCANMKSGKKK
jgi:predicted nucleotidyltransferase/GNAT superfamily N-acetyltransferase